MVLLKTIIKDLRAKLNTVRLISDLKRRNVVTLKTRDTVSGTKTASMLTETLSCAILMSQSPSI